MPGTAMPAQRASVVALTYFLSAQVYLTRRGQAQGEPRSVRAAARSPSVSTSVPVHWSASVA